MTSITRIPVYQVDAFSRVPFAGNPAAVCLPDAPLDAATMQAIAAEMNLSETAFPEPPAPDGARRLRWFTPEIEVPLCGHATLASAHVLFARGAESPICFHSASGPLVAHRDADGAIRLDFPANPPLPASPPPGLLEALGCDLRARTLRSRKAWLVRLQDAAAVRAVRPNFAALRTVELSGGPLGVAVTAPGTEDEVDFVSRFFAPWVGVDEDPVTGVAHTVLGPYWAAELQKEHLRARQVSRRGGELGVTVAGDRVHLSGHAVTVMEGAVLLDR